MKIHLFSRVLGAPFVILAFISFYFGFDGDKDWFTYGLIPSTIILAIIYIFHKQIDLWWQKNYPIKLDKNERSLVERFNPFYNSLSAEDKLVFEQRLYTFIHSKEFSAIGQETESVPHDVKVLLAMIAVEISFAEQTKFLYDNFDHIILYKHPFPTPRHQFLHTLETHAEDGVLLFALDYFSSAVHERDRYYHVGYHLFAEAFIFMHPKKEYPTDLSWNIIEQSCGFTKEQILSVLGFEAVDLLPITIYMYFVFGENLQKAAPQVYAQLHTIFTKSN